MNKPYQETSAIVMTAQKLINFQMTLQIIDYNVDGFQGKHRLKKFKKIKNSNSS